MKYLLLFVTILFVNSIIAQDGCSPYYPLKKGVEYDMESYDTKGKLQSKSVNKIIDSKEIANGMEATISSEVMDKKDKPINNAEFTFKCQNGVFSVDMQSFLDQSQMSAYEGMDVKVDAEYLDIPGNLEKGQKLKDGYIKLTMGNGGATLMTMTVNITNRMVEGKESITTPAGTFDCSIISYDVESVMGAMMPIKIKASSKEWYSEGVGMVRSESYRKGKLQGYTLLTRMVK